MSKRIRKKWLKKHGLYVNPSDCWNLDYNIAQYVIPRLKIYKEKTIGYPGRGEMDTFEKWIAGIDKMIEAFELVIDQIDGNVIYLKDGKFQEELMASDKQKIQEGLHLFATWFESLWW